MKVKWEIEWTEEWEEKRTNKLPHEHDLRMMFAKLVSKSNWKESQLGRCKNEGWHLI